MSLSIRRAVEQDIAEVTYCVCQAFIHYIPRIGKQPGPMLDDYRVLVGQGAVHVACQQEQIVGSLVLLETAEGFSIETIAVLPSGQGLGIGSKLLAYAETVAKQSDYRSIYLSTNCLMYESQLIYAHVGYIEYDRRNVSGYDRIFLRKQLV